MKLNRKYITYPVLIFVICYFILANWSTGASLVKTLWGALSPFVMGAGLAYIVNIVMVSYERLYDRLFKSSKGQKMKRPISMILAYLTFFLLIIMLFAIVLPDLIASIQSLLSIDSQTVRDVISQLENNKQLAQVMGLFGSQSDIGQLISQYSQSFLQQILTVLTNLLTSVSSIASTVISLFVSFVFSIYVLANKEKLARQASLLIETYLSKWSQNIYYLADILHQRFHGFFVSETIEASILGSLCALGMFILQMPYVATISVLIGFTALIPIVGAYIGVTVGAILIATQSFMQALIFIVFIVILQQIEGNFIYPRVVGGSIGLPSMWVLLAITVGGALAGIFGMLVAVPIFASLYQVIKDHVAKQQQNTNNSAQT